MVSVLLGLLGCWFIVYAYRVMGPATASISAPARSDRNEKHLIQFRKDVEAAIQTGSMRSRGTSTRQSCETTQNDSPRPC